MKIDRFIKAALLGLTLSVSAYAVTAPTAVSADNLRVVKSGTSSRLQVPLNRAIVVESDTPFAELSIANPGIADLSSLSDRTIYVLGKSPGTTTMTLFDAAGRLITNIDVVVTPDLSEFKERLRQILPGEKIEVRSANDGIVLSGIVSSAQKLSRALELAERYAPERVSNLMSVGGIQQVMLKVRFAEMQRSVSKSLSSSLSLSGGIGSDLGVRAGSGTLTTNGGSTSAIAGELPGANTNTGAILFGFNAGSTQVGILLEALEQKGVVRFLAEPNLVALSGQEAKFLAGGEYPIPIAQDDGGTAIEFKPFGVELSFIPRVVDKDLINLELKAAVSAIDPANGITLNGGFSVAAFSRRETSTTVEMRDGESFAIAGLLQDDFTDNSSQLPWIGDVPVLGALFRSANYQRSQTELVIIISSHLVTPTRGEALTLPTDRIKPPTEKDLFMFGRTAAGTRTPKKGAAGEVAKQDFTGSYGYVLD
ncbi:type II and III secretion system protein family protein [Sulfitobacter sp. F26169L]|uniref:type II and III secretion system protein family protein n=1 Tax=Sulfitobacter sp. F26169L TaxID=2996015 RepID=UPI002260A206|nr:type II and III secretion system protein family protein [Sulfitobacter sp. F26169L]MCX7567598.1 type II and III secretion system protein family protein [Sulfitobacter sp. F26169L]